MDKMLIQLTISSQLLVLLLSLFVNANNDYENKLNKHWSLSSASNDTPRTVVTSASILIEPTSYSDGSSVNTASPRQPKISSSYRNEYAKKYGFRPRARKEEPSQVERSIHYTDDTSNQKKTEILFPGNYFTISEVKRKDNLTEDKSFNPLDGVPFHPKIIPLVRGEEIRRRSLDMEIEPTIEKPNGYMEPNAMRRSISCK